MSRPSRFSDIFEEIERFNIYIREQQASRAYAFPASLAPDTRLRETEVNYYMSTMGLYYEYRKSYEDVTLELMQLLPTGYVNHYASVGVVYSADFFWTRHDMMRVNVIAVRQYTDYAVEHYQVFDMGKSIVALTVPMRAWHNWRTWCRPDVKGIHPDHRILFMLLGDRSQIGNKTLEQFSKLSIYKLRTILAKFEPGRMLNRPSIEEAGLVEESVTTSPPPLVEVSPTPSSSSSSPESGPKSPEPQKPKKNPFSLEAMGVGTPSNKPSTSRQGHHTEEIGEPRKFLPFARPPFVGRGAGMMGPKWQMPKEFVDDKGVLLKMCMKGPNPSLIKVFKAAEKLAQLEVANDDDEVDDAQEPGDSSLESFQEETSVESSDQSKDCSGMFDMTGVSSQAGDTSIAKVSASSATSSDWDGPLPMDDSVEVFLAKRINNSQVVNVSTDSSVLELSRGQISDSSIMEI